MKGVIGQTYGCKNRNSESAVPPLMPGCNHAKATQSKQMRESVVRRVRRNAPPSGKAFGTYFTTAMQRMVVTEALASPTSKRRTTSTPRCTAAASAASPALCAWRRACRLDPRLRIVEGWHSPRPSQESKYGLVKARKAKQYTKR